ncbi:MAG TPA: PA domain-containing protein, partial [Luteitalea sp.]|nr:PA domain-containing protein [Luteitalea sp.]
DLDPTDYDMVALFNSELGKPGCLEGSPFYLGLDNNHGSANDLVTVLLHEFSHGLGFLSTTDPETGEYLAGYPSVYDHFLYDATQELAWTSMTPAQRAVSAVNARRVAWTGAHVTRAAPDVLDAGTAELRVIAPTAIAGAYLVGTASFGPPPGSPGVTGEVMPVVDQANGIGLACTPLNAANTLAVAGKIALVDRGGCAFTQKALSVQAAGAIGMIVADTVAGGPPPSLGGIDPSITIPAVRITQADGGILKAALRTRSRTRSGLRATIGVDPTVLAGTDALGRVLVYTPSPVDPGSSVSHWDTIASPNQLMEPFISDDLLHTVAPPRDLTLPLLRDIGWNP